MKLIACISKSTIECIVRYFEYITLDQMFMILSLVNIFKGKLDATMASNVKKCGENRSMCSQNQLKTSDSRTKSI